MMVGFKYYSNKKIAAELLVSIAIIAFLLTMRIDHLFFFAVPKPVVITLPPPTPAQACSNNISSYHSYTSALSTGAYSLLSNYTLYSSTGVSGANASIRYIKLLYSAMNSSLFIPGLLGTVSGYNLSSSYSASDPCSFAGYNVNISQAEALGVLLGHNISIFKDPHDRAEFLALNVDTSLLPTPYWANVTPLLSLQEPQPMYTGLYSIELMNGLWGALNNTEAYVSKYGPQEAGFPSLSINPMNTSLGGMVVSYIPPKENLTALSQFGYAPQDLPLVALSGYSCFAHPYQSNATCDLNSTQSARRLMLYELLAEQQTGYSLAQIAYHRSFNPSITFAGYRNGHLLLEIGNVRQSGMANATISVEGKNYNYTRFLSYFYVNANLSTGYQNISFKAQNLVLSTTLYVNPEVAVSFGSYHLNGSSELYLSNIGRSNISIYNLKASSTPESNSIVPVISLQPGSSTGVLFTGEPCNASIGPQVPIYVHFNSSSGDGIYYTTVSCG